MQSTLLAQRLYQFEPSQNENSFINTLFYEGEYDIINLEIKHYVFLRRFAAAKLIACHVTGGCTETLLIGMVSSVY